MLRVFAGHCGSFAYGTETGDEIASRNRGKGTHAGAAAAANGSRGAEGAAADATAAGVSRQTVLDALTASGAPMRIEDLAAQLGQAAAAEPAALDAVLAELERSGQVIRNRAGLLLLSARANLLAGQVQGHRDGFGFLIRDDRGPDVALPESEMSKVVHGDRVLVRVRGTDRRGRPEGEIVEVVERRTHQLVGRLINERGVSIVVPEDQRIRHDILVPPHAAGKARDGQVVVVEIVQQPQRDLQAVGRVIEVLGEIDDPGMEIEIAVRKFGVPHQFAETVLTQARSLPPEVGKGDLRGRVDLRDVPLVTIDGEDARDFDDAVYCEPIARGGWRLIVAIADVDHYVAAGSELDFEAQNRSTSVYFPRRVIPMLPEELSNGLCSLNPEVDRLVMVCDMVVAKKGTVRAYQFYPAVMHSHARLTYTEVWEVLSNPASRATERRRTLLPQLHNLHELYLAFSKARIERGALDFETTETQILCDPQGRIERIVPRTRNDAHRLIEECMLAANVCAADFLHRKRHPALYRVHEGPTPQKLEALRATLKAFSLQLEGGENPSPHDYARLAERVRTRPDSPLLQTMLLRSMQQAIYSPHNSGHFGLAYEAYAHFTSPIRRYPDLLVHRAIKASLGDRQYQPALGPVFGEGDDEGGAALVRWEKLGNLCSVNERRADDASRDVEAWLKSYYVRERVGETYTGSISAVVPFGIFVVLDELFVEGLVHVSELGSEYFQFNEATHELRGERTGMRFRLGDRLVVQVARVDLEARRIDFRLVKPGEDRRPEGEKRPAAAKRAPGEGVEERRRRQAIRAERLAARREKPQPATAHDKKPRARKGRK